MRSRSKEDSRREGRRIPLEPAWAALFRTSFAWNLCYKKPWLEKRIPGSLKGGRRKFLD